MVPAAVAVPLDQDDLLTLVDHARQTGMPLVPRGAGSGIPGGNIGPGVIVDLRRFTAPLDVCPDGTAMVGAAVTWGAIDAAAGAHHLRLGPNPSSGAFCTIGGMVSTNAAGARTVRAGSIRPWVRGVELVTADGESGWIGRASGGRRTDDRAALRRLQEATPRILAATAQIEARFPRTRKNSSGYALDQFVRSRDPLDLIIGAEGSLGFVSRVELALEQRPDGISTVVLRLDALDRLPGVVESLLALKPSAVELLDRTFLLIAAPRLPFPVNDIELVLLVEFEAADSGAAKRLADEAVGAVGDRARVIGTGVTEADREALWSIRHAASPALAALPPHRRSLQIVEDGCVPVAKLDQYLSGIRAAAERQGVEIVAFGHAGDGHLHVNALVDTGQPDLDRRLEALLADAMELLGRLGGTPSGEHGDGRLRTPWLERLFGPDITDLFRQVKRAFDPAGIMNPGVKVPLAAPAPLMQQLKVGPHAAVIPEAIEAGLRRIERGGLWGMAGIAGIAGTAGIAGIAGIEGIEGTDNPR